MHLDSLYGAKLYLLSLMESTNLCINTLWELYHCGKNNDYFFENGSKIESISKENNGFKIVLDDQTELRLAHDLFLKVYF